MRARSAARASLLLSAALGGCSDDYTPMHKVLEAQFRTGEIVDLGAFVPGNWAALCLHGQYETVRALSGSSKLTCTGDSVGFESDDQRISYMTEDDRCFSIVVPKWRPSLPTRTDCYRKRGGFKFRLDDTPSGKMVQHVPNE